MNTTAGIARSVLPLLFSLPLVLARPSPPPGPSPLPEGATVHRDLAYVPGGHERQKLDLYLPEDGKDLPLIINIHGGAFKRAARPTACRSSISRTAMRWPRSTTA